MVRAQRAKRIKKPQTKEQYDSDDAEGYKDMPVPNKKSAQYSKDKIDTFHDEKISNLLARGVQMDSDLENTDEEEEVLPLDVSDTEDDEEDGEEEQEEESDMESDLEGKKDEDLPNDQAWGNRKKMFYDSDYMAAKGKTQEQVEAEDAEEEEEAKNIQKRLAADLSEEDYDLTLLQEFAVEEKEVGQKERIVKDLKEMSQKEKMKLLKKESPELLELIADFKSKLAELKDEVQPLLMMVEDGRIPPGKGANYLKTKQMLYQNYCTNISFYLVLKAKRIPAHNHPVIERLVTYRNLINELKAVDVRLAPQLRLLLAGEAVTSAARRTPGSGKETKKVKVSEESGLEVAEDSDLDEEAALLFYKQVEERMKRKRKIKTLQPGESLAEGEAGEEMDEDDVAKRGITYEMAKNKGLTPKRKKINRNPRVKHREKFRRAKIRRKGQVRSVHTETSKYSGEASGIRAGVKKSVKLK